MLNFMEMCEKFIEATANGKSAYGHISINRYGELEGSNPAWDHSKVSLPLDELVIILPSLLSNDLPPVYCIRFSYENIIEIQVSSSSLAGDCQALEEWCDKQGIGYSIKFTESGKHTLVSLSEHVNVVAVDLF